MRNRIKVAVAHYTTKQVAIVGAHGFESHFEPGDRLFDEYKDYVVNVQVVEDLSDDQELIFINKMKTRAVITKDEFDEHNIFENLLDSLELYYPNDNTYFQSRRYKMCSRILNRLLMNNIIKKAQHTN
tara:strand:- start:207 stop:590 length:384 start_codon:yes stop_codon:yes gene_type:complete